MLQWIEVPNHETPFASDSPLGAANIAELAKPVDKATDTRSARSASAAVWAFMTPNVRAKPRVEAGGVSLGSDDAS